MTLRKIAFLHIVPFERDAPARGLEEALQLFSYAEELGLDGGWIRTRHLQYGVSSPAVFLTAAAARTKRIDLGVAVIPTGYESPVRLAEDLATADLLSGGRLHPGLSVGALRHPDAVLSRLFDDPAAIDTSYEHVDRFLSLVRGEPVDEAHEIGLGGVTESSSDRVEPHSPGLASRISYGAGSVRSAEYAGRAGLDLLVSNITTGAPGQTFSEAQREQIDAYRAVRGDGGTVRLGHVLVPTDRADAARRARFEEYVSARTPRTRSQGEHGRLIAEDVAGSASAIVERLREDVAFQAVDELLFELPFSFDLDDYRHILREVAEHVGPALGWTPAS
jgi:alkanesulfonate monooxygenase SsuD/methylene tetrahydromethanopterin reductase-like flavin-dependent oxidoreductase (luciferase family)